MRDATAADRQLVRRASASVAVQAAVAVALVVLAMTAVVLVVDDQQQHRQADSTTRSAWARADDVSDPPAGIWLVLRTAGGRTLVTSGAPEAVREVDPSTQPDGASRLTSDGQELAVWTGDRTFGRLSAVYDLSPRESERNRLLVSLGVAAVLGIAGAAGVGALIGRRAVRPMGEALGLQRRFVADASHELRTPLTVLHTRAQLLRRRLAGQTSDPATREELDRLVRDAQSLGEVVTDLLLAAELEHAPQRGEPVDVGAVAREVVASLSVLADEREVALTTSGTDDGVEVVGIEAALRRALTALVDNALAHTGSGGHVQVRVSESDSHVLIAVADDGEGLDPAEARDLARRFARGTARDGGRRFGLGLALVDEVARVHGGRLDVEGAPGQGATFTLRLPGSGR
ncbi:MAG TPA: HAMP domain-containing sensor histidine kinase [Angustibacter sp.]|nr:HAMP domain-containing sensor histidine kinase [Angustibacter sp.]